MRDKNNGTAHTVGRGAMLRILMTGAAIGLTAAAMAWPGGSAFAQSSQAIEFDIPASSLNMALRRFAQQSGLQVAYQTSIASDATTRAIKGRLTSEQALSAILANSGLRYSLSGNGAVTILGATAAAPDAVDGNGSTLLQQIVVDGAGGAYDRVDGYRAQSSSTGSKSDTPIIETPQSISVVTADQIASQRATSLSDTLAYTPGIATQSGSFSRMVDDFMIRGFNTASGSTGTLRDGLKFQSNVYDGGQEPYGLERVEVLRGASSVLYGQVAPGGVVNAISKRPTRDTLREVNVEYGSYNRKQVSADFGGQLDEDGVVTYRLTGLYRDGDNWVDSTPDNKVYIAPAVTFQPTDVTSLTLLGSYQHVKTGFAPPYQLTDIKSGWLTRDSFTGVDGFDTYESDIYTIGGIFEHEFDNGLRLRSAARYFDANVNWDYMMPNVAPSISSAGILSRLASERDEISRGVTSDTSLEYKFDALGTEHTLLGGFDYYRRTYDSHRYRGTLSTLNLRTGVNGAPNVSYAVDRGSDSVGDQYGIYLQDQIKFNDHWVLALGGRHDWSDSSSKSYQNGVVTKTDDSAYTGRAGLVYLFDNGLAPYVSVSQSFLPQVGADFITKGPLKPNEGLQYEAGIRYQPAGTDLQFSAAVYDLNQKNVVSYDTSGNAYQQGEVQSRGLELEARGEFGNWGLVAAYTYTDAEIVRSAKVAEIGEQVALVPRNTFSFWADYGLDELGLEGVRIGGGLRYVGQTNLTDNVANGPAYTLFDAMATVDLGKFNAELEGLDLKLNARNLFDRKYYTCVSSDGCRFGEPMTVSATLSYKW